MYLSSQLFMSSSPIFTGKGNTQRIQGPSIEITSRYDKSKFGMDNVLSIRCRFWPKSAAEWIDRPRHHGWPLLKDKEKIVEFGCHLVPIGHPTSPLKPLQWRISFSIVERTLAWSFNHTQMQCYAVMKLILKEFIKKKCSEESKDVLCSYFIKTFLFWQYESTDPLFWQSQNLNGCLIYLLQEFYECIRTGVLRHYFISRFNLLEIKLTSEAKQELLKILDFVIRKDLDIFLYCSSLSDVWLIFTRGRDRNQIETHELRRGQIRDNEYAMIKALDSYRDVVCFNRHSLFHWGDSLVELENEITQDIINTSLLLMCFRCLCTEITVKNVCCFHRGNKSLYNNLRVLNSNRFGVDIASSQLWLATLQFQYKDYLATLKTVNNVLSSIPPFALYCSGDRIHAECSSAYRDMCYMGNVNVVRRAKKAWLFDIHMAQEDFEFVPRAIQIEQLHCDPHVGVSISPFVYAYYLMFLGYHGLSQYDNRDRALRQLVDIANDPLRRGRIYHSYNITGHCLLITGHTEMAKDLFLKSAHNTEGSVYDTYNSAYQYLSYLQ